MSCENEQELVCSLLDRRINGEQRENALAHVASCGTCNAAYESMQTLRASLRTLPTAPPPAHLEANLRVLASHERVRRLSRVNMAARCARWSDTAHLWFENLMRPMALPFAGGLLSALLLFAMWLPGMATTGPVRGDVTAPVLQSMFHPYTDPGLGRLNPVDEGGDVVVTLLIDERGRVMDCKITGGESSPELTNMILFSKWTPATVYGKPVWGTVVFHRYEINVKG